MGLARRSRTSVAAVLVVLGGFLLGVSMLSGVATASPSNDQAGSHSTSGNSGTSGTTSSPQPQSTADMNSGGANGQCPSGTYCSTRNGSASGNGNGGGKATGKPCAGCVGKADNKNPPGQEKTSPRTTFPNNGYECDNNNGIGKTNPAHTGCRTSSTTTSDCTTNPTAAGCTQSDCTTNPTAAGCTQSDCTTNPTAAGCTKSSTDCATNPTAAGCTHSSTDCTTNPTAAGCASTTGGTQGGGTTAAVLGENLTHVPTSVLGERLTHIPSTVAGERQTTPPSSLPFTGSAARLLMTIGAAAMLAGTFLLGLGAYRRRTS